MTFSSTPGGRYGAGRLLAALSGIPITGHAVTLAHLDHQGSSHAVCERFDVPLMCGAGDRAALETGDLVRVLPKQDFWLARVSRQFAGPGHPVARRLCDGDEIGGFAVIETPGHTPGHLALWRERDRVLVLGDVLLHRNPATLRRSLAEPFRFASFDAALEPAVVCFGHGEPLKEPERFQRFVATLEAHDPPMA